MAGNASFRHERPNLESYESAATLTTNTTMAEVVRKLRAREMPPEEKVAAS